MEQQEAQLRAIREATEPWIVRARRGGSLHGRAPDLQESADREDSAQLEDDSYASTPASITESLAVLPVASFAGPSVLLGLVDGDDDGRGGLFSALPL